MGIPEDVVAKVVGKVSERMADPSYAQLAVGTFVQTHPDASRFVTAHSDELGGGEGVIHVVFHGQVMVECFLEHVGHDIPPIGFADLDAASTKDALAELSNKQPALASYLTSNVDEETVRSLLAHIGLTLDLVARR